VATDGYDAPASTDVRDIEASTGHIADVLLHRCQAD